MFSAFQDSDSFTPFSPFPLFSEFSDLFLLTGCFQPVVVGWHGVSTPQPPPHFRRNKEGEFCPIYTAFERAKVKQLFWGVWFFGPGGRPLGRPYGRWRGLLEIAGPAADGTPDK